MLETSRLWRRVVDDVAGGFADVEVDHMLVDNAAMQLVQAPERFDVIVTENMFGDILSDEAAAVTGGLGLAGSASLGDAEPGLFEPVHGSAPDVAGAGVANPAGMLRSVALMLGLRSRPSGRRPAARRGHRPRARRVTDTRSRGHGDDDGVRRCRTAGARGFVRGTAESVMERADALARFSESTGEITRPYGTESLRAALDAAAGWLAEAGMTVRRDAIGNVIGRRGADELPTLLLGSHLDSVRDAGRYDGPLGVLVAGAAAERLAADELPYAVEVVAFADEEGLRFKSSYLASRAYAGLLDEAELELTADDGEPLADAVLAMGGDPAEACSGAGVPERLLGYLEVHIEQGPVLEAEGLPVGVVTAIAGQSRGFVDLIGEAGHAGNTPPDLRRDALCGAAELVLGVEAAMREEPGLIATVGRVEVAPNVGNVIPGHVTLSYDVRHQDDAVRVAAIADLETLTAAICDRRGLRPRAPAASGPSRCRHVAQASAPARAGGRVGRRRAARAAERRGSRCRLDLPPDRRGHAVRALQRRDQPPSGRGRRARGRRRCDRRRRGVPAPSRRRGRRWLSSISSSAAARPSDPTASSGSTSGSPTGSSQRSRPSSPAAPRS